jgi:putative DNA primase/helicase
VVEFLDDITKREEDRDTLLDHLAHGLMPGHPYRAFVMMYGPGSNGKTRVGKLLRGFVGEDNAASVELQDLTGDDDFATGALPGAFLNVGDDISVSEIRDASILKSVTGDGTIRANEKYEKKYEFQNEAAMFFSANEPPRISEDKEAVYDRLYPIEMPNRFVNNPSEPHEKQKIPGIAEDILDDDEAMRGLLLLAVKHAQELIESGGEYSMPEGPQERKEMYEAASDPIHRFALDYLESGDGNDKILKEDAYSVYSELCNQQNERVASEQGFKSAITQMNSIDVESGQTRTLTSGDNAETCWSYVRFTEDAKELMPSRLQLRYFDESEEDTEETGIEDAEDEWNTAFHADPIEGAADTLTGYVTVTGEIVTVQELQTDGSNIGQKAILKDRTGAIDIVAWDDEMCAELVGAEGETVAILNAEVTEYNGTRQLTPVQGLTEIKEIQPGVGYTETPEASDNQDLSAAADGGAEVDENDKGQNGPMEPSSDADSETNTEDDSDGSDEDLRPEVSGVTVPRDATGPAADARRIAQYIDERTDSKPKAVLNATLTNDIPGFMTLQQFQAGLEKGLENGTLIEDDGDIKPNL